jgi:predicted nuclease of predicted toxin-antitoxin system
LKFLFDQNLSRKLPKKLADLYPDSTHVIAEHLDTAPDSHVREFAASNGFTIVTRDRDFADLDALIGPPPKVIWICRENSPTADYERLLRVFHEQIEAFGADTKRSLLVIS